MKEKYYKYAKLLLNKGLCINEHQPLLINAPVEAIDFVRVLTEVACQMNITDIYYDWYDDELKHTQLKNYNQEAIENSRFWNKEIHNEYAKKDAAFLFLTESNPDIMKDIDSNKLKIASTKSLLSRQTYRDMQENNQIDWCIAPVATEVWGTLIFKDDENPKEKLWNLLFDICLVDEKEPEKSWEDKMNNNKLMCQKLTNLNIKGCTNLTGLWATYNNIKKFDSTTCKNLETISMKGNELTTAKFRANGKNITLKSNYSSCNFGFKKDGKTVTIYVNKAPKGYKYLGIYDSNGKKLSSSTEYSFTASNKYSKTYTVKYKKN